MTFPGMRVVFSGSRDMYSVNAQLEIADYILALLDRSGAPRPAGGIEACAGESGNVDIAARDVCARYGIPFSGFTADWNKHGKGAGPVRNAYMATWARAARHAELFAVWDGKSTGTADMILTAHREGFNQVSAKVIRLERVRQRSW